MSQPAPGDAGVRDASAPLELVVAMAANRVIGRGGKLPWHLPDDLKHFKRLTLGHAVIMGRRTHESIGGPLPGRTNVVISSTLTAGPRNDEVIVVPSLDEAVRVAAAASASRVFVIGGAVLYAAAVPRVGVLHVTELDEAVAGDTFFPPIHSAQWRLTGDVRHERDDRHAIAFHFRTYERSQFRPPLAGGEGEAAVGGGDAAAGAINAAGPEAHVPVQFPGERR